jgi:hypothetical protein
MVPKADGSFRPCGDYRRLNTVTEDDRYPLPSIQDFTANLAGCTVFSKTLVKGYYQVPMAESDIPKTAICTPFGLFEYIFMPWPEKCCANISAANGQTLPPSPFRVRVPRRHFDLQQGPLRTHAAPPPGLRDFCKVQVYRSIRRSVPSASPPSPSSGTTWTPPASLRWRSM